MMESPWQMVNEPLEVITGIEEVRVAVYVYTEEKALHELLFVTLTV
jgi:hypothetical protein